MTVVVAFVTADAAVMGSDSEATEADQTRSATDKIWACGSLVLGYTGISIVSQPLQVALQLAVPPAEAGRELSRWEMRAVICSAMKPVLDSAYANYSPELPPGHMPNSLAGTLLAIGHDADGYYLLEVDKNNGGSFYENFHAVGSGSVAAQVGRALLMRDEPLGRSVAHLQVLAYRTIATCVAVLGGEYGVGGEIRIWQAESGAAFRELDDTERASVANGVEQWEKISAEALDKVVAEEPEPEGETMPEAIDQSTEGEGEGEGEGENQTQATGENAA